MAMMDIRRRSLGGGKLALIAIGLGVVGCFCNIPSCFYGGMFGYSLWTESGNRKDNEANLKAIGEALNKYANAQQDKGFPPAVRYSTTTGQPLLSWRVELLPYLEDGKVYSDFKLDQPWDSDNNKALLEKMPKVFNGPSKEENDKGLTHYRVFHKPSDLGTSPNPVFVVGKKLQLSEIKDPKSTILVVEAAEAVEWTRPEEIVFPVSGIKDPIASKLFGPSKKSCTILYASGDVRTIKAGELTDADFENAIVVKGK
jgi:hypothetical protein